MRCVITDYMGDDASLEASLLQRVGIEVVVAPIPDPEAWVDEAEGAEAILTRHAPIRAATIQRLRRCRVIARYGTGHDNIDLAAARARGIVVTNVPDYCWHEVAEHTMTLLLMAVRHIDALRRPVREGGWIPQPLPPLRRLRGRRMGLIGYGRIGGRVAELAQAFGLVVRVYDPYLPEPPPGITLEATLEDLLRGADIVSLHVPLTPETYRILDDERLALLPEGAIVINTARGGLLDLDAALGRLRSGRLAGVAIDVAEREPLPSDHPARNLDGLIVTPHVGYFSTTSVEEAKRRSTAEVIRVLNGAAPIHPVGEPA
ncbi:MAG: C-terminal binding protein [Actinomycetota bacterium]|nr:C-terminal binding protein [Actinomycetota bacterium]